MATSRVNVRYKDDMVVVVMMMMKTKNRFFIRSETSIEFENCILLCYGLLAMNALIFFFFYLLCLTGDKEKHDAFE